MEEQASTLLATLKRSSVPVETKVQQFNNLKSSIKHLRVPDAAQATSFECIRIAITSSSPQLVTLGFSTLGHLTKRLSLQEQSNVVVAQSNKMLPVFLERLGDAREAHRSAASSALADIWPLNREKVEVLVRDSAMAGQNARAKETAMKWLVKMHKTDGFLLRSFVPPLVAGLEDADGVVRETAKSAVVELFRNASEKAKSDVKKQMSAHNVRKATVQHITSQLEGSRPPLAPAASDLKASTMSLPNFSSTDGSHLTEGFGDSVMSEVPPPPDTVAMEPLYIHSQRDLEEAFREMHPHFEGRETEHNWIHRDRSVTKLRRLTAGNAPTEFHVAFLLGIKGLIDAINKVANSLRTTMSSNGCQLVQELAKTLGTSFDPMTDFFLPGFIKMGGATKHISQQNGNVTADTIFANVSYHMRLMQQVWSAFQEKNGQIRACAPGWLQTMVKKHTSKSHFEAATELVEKCLRKGLADASPKVKEGSRSAYWTYARYWPSKAEAFMASLDARSQGFVNKDPANPNASLASSQSSVPAADGNRPLTAASGRASVRETIMAQRKAMKAAKDVERPNSAASVLPSGTREVSATSLRGAMSTANIRQKATLGASTKPPPSGSASSSNSAGGLMSAPLRRPRRQELARPATADPYARGNRGLRLQNQTTPSESPSGSPGKASTVRRSPGKTVQTPASRLPVSPPRSKSRVEQLAASGRRRAPSLEAPSGSSPRNAEDMTYVVPFAQQADDDPAASVGRQRPKRTDKTMSVDSGIAGLSHTPTEDEGFTMVIPDLKASTGSVSKASPSKIPSPRPSPRTTISERGSPAKSPMSRASRSPLPQRQLFPRQEEAPQEEEVKVYEDPFVADDSAPRPRSASPEKPVLEELPLNERNVEREHRLVSEGSSFVGSNERNRQAESPLRSPIKSGSAEVTHDRAETLRGRRLLSSGIERVRACTLDGHGFRRLQDVVKQGNEDIWYTEADASSGSPTRRQNKFAELMNALLDYLSTPLDPAKFAPGKAQTLKTQALATVRAMLALWKKEGDRFVPGVVCAVVRARSEWDNSSHLGSELERTTDDVVALLNTPAKIAEAVEGVLAVIEEPPAGQASGGGGGGGSSNSRVASAALAALAQLLAMAGRAGMEVPPSQAQRLGAAAVRFLGDADPDVRRADMEVCLELHARLGGSGSGSKGPAAAASEGGGNGNGNGNGTPGAGEGGAFWKTIRDGGLRPEQQNLITYYLARRARA